MVLFLGGFEFTLQVIFLFNHVFFHVKYIIHNIVNFLIQGVSNKCFLVQQCLKISSFNFQGHLIATVSGTSVVKGRFEKSKYETGPHDQWKRDPTNEIFQFYKYYPSHIEKKCNICYMMWENGCITLKWHVLIISYVLIISKWNYMKSYKNIFRYLTDKLLVTQDLN